jgi:hypothetical protein
MLLYKITVKNMSENNKIKRNYPRVSLEDALKIPTAIKEKNGGNPWPPSEVAAAVNIAPKSTNFFYQTSASQAFGLTKGTREAANIELEELGRDIVYAQDSKQELENKRKAFFNVPIFKSVFEHYKGSELPETRYLSNTLESKFGLDPELHEEFVELFTKNCNFLKLDSESPIVNSENKFINTPTDSETTVIISEAKGKNAQEIFVIMPFSERQLIHSKGFFTEVLNSLIIPAASGAGFTVRTANRTGNDIIQSTIVNALIDADLVVADLTEHNPNVLFELGLRMALEKPVLLIRATGTDKIFDVDNMLRVSDYNPNLWTSTLKGDIPELTKNIKAAWEGREARSYINILKNPK